MKNILIINGSLRKNSFNQQLAQEAAKLLEHTSTITYLNIRELPFMNEDIEFPAPASIQKIRNEIKKADGLWIFTPEYNGQIPGVLKNALDWLSRGEIARDRSSSVMINKPVTISSAAGRSAGINARKSLYQLLNNMSMNVIYSEGTGIVLDKEAFITGKLKLSEQDLIALSKQAETFYHHI
ncbi:MAG: NAD(P)H-dependent oxidoreductase [Erysipelotrichaceae bacterium]|nr:NAD(P)H-dependent oxidoreductase [Erysipelotrichaceae bacterium]